MKTKSSLATTLPVFLMKGIVSFKLCVDSTSESVGTVLISKSGGVCVARLTKNGLLLGVDIGVVTVPVQLLF